MSRVNFVEYEEPACRSQCLQGDGADSLKIASQVPHINDMRMSVSSGPAETLTGEIEDREERRLICQSSQYRCLF